VTLLALTVLASDESKKSGPIGLAVILVLCVVCYFLFKSMSRHLRKVREDFGGPKDVGGVAQNTAPMPPTAEASAPSAETPNDAQP
jgi:predicted permease